MKTLFFAIVAVTAATAQPGTLDQTFSEDGKLTVSLSTANNTANAIAVQPDSKIIIAGTVVNTANADFGVTRYNADGSIDLTFNATGKALVDFNNTFDHCAGMALQPDGKIVLGGYTDNGNGFDFALARLNSNGTPDTTFGIGGKKTAHFEFTVFANALALQPDGKILIAGFAIGAESNLLTVARFRADGAPDTTFGNQGKIMVPVGEGAAIANAICVQDDQKIVVAGQVMNEAMFRWESLVSRFNANGTPDTDFGTQGHGIVAVPAKDYIVNAIAIEPDGKILTAGVTSTSPSTSKTTLARYLPNGTLDLTFAQDGIGIVPLGPLANQPESMLLLDGKIIVAGSLQQGNADRFVLASFGSDGLPTASFGDNGVTATAFGLQDGINAIAVCPDGKIVACGVSFSATVSQFAAARYHTEASLAIAHNQMEDAALSVFPNPLDVSSQLRFMLNEPQNVSVILYDSFGRKIRYIADSQILSAGIHEMPIETASLPTGVYYAVYSDSKITRTLKLLK
jgi:uncharacterized delta-60 repeat protein